MKLSTRGRYAVMAMVDIASRNNTAVNLSGIALRQGISLSYLEQLFSKLKKSGLVISVRGPGGGYRLALRPDKIRIADVMLSVNEPLKATRCKDGSPGGCALDHQRCLTHDLWDELGRQMTVFHNSVTLADVVKKNLPSNEFYVYKGIGKNGNRARNER